MSEKECMETYRLECVQLRARIAQKDSALIAQLSRIERLTVDLDRLTAENQRLTEVNGLRASQVVEARETIGSLKEKLADFESTLTAVRAERPEVANIASRDATLTDEEIKASGSWQLYSDRRALLAIVTELQRSEAAWRNARDVWLEDRKEQARLLSEYKAESSEKLISCEARVRELVAETKALKAERDQYLADWLALSQDDGKVERALESAEARVRELEAQFVGIICPPSAADRERP